MKFITRSLNSFFLMLIIGMFASCDKEEATNIPTAINPFSNGTNERNMIVVISDIHLGANLDYAECKNNLNSLKNFIYKVKGLN